MRPPDPAWTARVARRVARRVRWSARLSWIVALATVVGAAAVVLAPDSADGPGLAEVVVRGAATPRGGPEAAAEGGVAPAPPVRVRLAQGEAAGDAPVEIRF